MVDGKAADHETAVSRLLIAPQAEADLRAAFLWYDQHGAGLGDAFTRQVEAKLEQVARAPQAFRPRSDPYRLAATARFPYALYFIWDEAADVVSVRRVLHFKRDARSEL